MDDPHPSSYPSSFMRMQPLLWMVLLVLTLAYSETSAASSPVHPQADYFHATELREESEAQRAPFAHAHASPIQLIADTKSGKSSASARAPGERPLPAFSGRTLAGTRLSMTSLLGKRVVFFFFNPEVKGAGTAATAVAQVAKLAQGNNFRIVGIGVGSTTSKVRAFAQTHAFDFPVIDDSNAQISSLLRVPAPLFIVGADAEGYMSFVIPGFDTSGDDAVERIADRIKESLRIRTDTVAAGPLIDHPKAPLFTTQDINGKPFDLASLKGKPIVLIFFLHTCPHCHHALAFFRDQLKKIPEAKRPALVGISLQNRPSTVRSAMAQENLDFFTPLMDPGQEILQSYGVAGGVPDISMINSEGRIIYRSNGWRDGRDPALMRMYLAKIAGERIPMLLSKKGYAGNDVCTVCHQEQAATWELTRHAQAYGTLVTHGKERDGECVSCHVVGFDEPGGFSFARPEKYLENVGCESSHGRGGPHLSPDFLKGGGYENACVQCHDKKHSLGFNYGTFLPNVSHVVIASMTPEQRAERFGAEASLARPLLPTQADYVGSDACQSCHTAEFKTWEKSPHAHAVATLEAKKKASDPQCLACHTTGYGRPGGFPKDGKVSAHPDLANVGCESCHGPGGDHVPADAPKFGTILSLGDKCDSCVILQICGSCHDEDNDPDFTFEVEDHIERQRHGTTEPGTGKPLGPTAARRQDHPRLAEALRWIQAPPS
ncbi:MAG: multiheme c-type cytochrome [Myxococcota bacterium]|nr:multiheme c-type cytochrome [Myxococcota bacterium]